MAATGFMFETLVPLCHTTRRHFTDHSKRHPTLPLQEITFVLVSLELNDGDSKYPRNVRYLPIDTMSYLRGL